jgi:hypothetical protein
VTRKCIEEKTFIRKAGNQERNGTEERRGGRRRRTDY